VLVRTPSMAQAMPHGSSYFTDNQHRSCPLWLLHKIDFIHLGWAKACARLNLVCRAILLIIHRRHVNDCNPVPDCAMCDNRLEVRASSLVDTAIQSTASTEATQALGLNSMEKQFVQKDGIWYATQRLQKEGSPDVHDLDFQFFYDAVSIRKLLPVLMVKSDLFHALLLYIHFVELPHAGVEVTLAWLKQPFYPIGHARRAIS
jgi:hypothetical protein